MICIKEIYTGGKPGQFRANSDMIGWKGDQGGQPLVHATSSVRRAEWLEGKLRVLCEEEGSEQVLALEGFNAADFDTLWRHFEQHCGVYIKKNRLAAALSEGNYDDAMQGMEKSADQVDAATAGSPLKKSRELDLLTKAEGVRDGLNEAVKGDKQALNRVFAANGCERIGRLRLVLDTVQLEVYDRDDRWLHLRHMAATVESVLRDLGTFRLWRPTECDPNSSIARRQMVWELRRRQRGESIDGLLGEESQVEEQPEEPAVSEVSRLREELANSNFVPVLPGPLDPNPLADGDPSDAVGSDPLSGGYDSRERGASDLMPAPLPAPAPADADDAGSEPGEDREVVNENGADDALLRQYEDQEVSDPLSMPAAPPGHEDDMGLNLSGEGRRKHYTRSDSILEGWVWKRSRFWKRWRRRWLVLTKLGLESLKQRGGLKPTESIEAGTVHSAYSADEEIQMARCFCVVGNGRSFYMVCDDEAQKAEWIKQVQQVLGTRR